MVPQRSCFGSWLRNLASRPWLLSPKHLFQTTESAQTLQVVMIIYLYDINVHMYMNILVPVGGLVWAYMTGPMKLDELRTDFGDADWLQPVPRVDEAAVEFPLEDEARWRYVEDTLLSGNAMMTQSEMARRWLEILCKYECLTVEWVKIWAFPTWTELWHHVTPTAIYPLVI